MKQYSQEFKGTAKHDDIAIMYHKYKLAFFVPMKAGNNSIKKMFLQDLKLGSNYVKTRNDLLELYTAEEVYNICNNYMKIGLTRNPYYRIVSCWYDKTVRTNFKDFHRFDIRKGISLFEFMNKVYNIPDKNADRHLKSQSYLFTYDNCIVPDYLYDINKLNKNWEYIKEMVYDHTDGELLLPELRHEHSNKIDHDKYLEDNVKYLIACRYTDDFTNFNYKK